MARVGRGAVSRKRWPRFSRALAVATVLMLAASGGTAYQLGVRAKRPPVFSRGGSPFGSRALETPTPTESTPTASTATSTPTAGASATASVAPSAPAESDRPRYVILPPEAAPRQPKQGNYIYHVEGSEEATGFGGRDFPPEMTMSVFRSDDLRSDEIAFDLEYSDKHEEREILAYREDGISFTFEGGSVTFTITRTSDADYEPNMLQIPMPLRVGRRVSGFSRAHEADGHVTRIEDWTVEVLRRERIAVAGGTADTWVVRINRQSRPGSEESVTRTRTYWYDPGRRLWVKFTELMHGEQHFGPGAFTYDQRSTVTLVREP